MDGTKRENIKVGQVVEIVIRDDHVMRILLRRMEPGVDMIEAVPAVEVDAGNQRVAALQFAHDRVQRR